MSGDNEECLTLRVSILTQMPRYIAILFALPLLLSCNESAEAKPLAKNFVEPAKSLEEQFDGLYKSLNVLPLPISLSQVEYYDSELSKLFTKIPKTLIPAFKFIYDDEHNSYDKDNVWAAKMLGYRNLKIVIIRTYFQSGQDVLFLCTFLNNAIVDHLTIYSEGDWEYDGGFGVAETSFLIKSNYEILVKRAHYPNPADRENELDVKQNTYIINDEGKFVKK